MAAVILLDTHVVVWLYTGQTQRLSDRAAQLIEESTVTISPAVELELAYLHEVGRVTVGPAEITGDLAVRIGLQIEQIPFSLICAHALGLSWTRDPFDRLQAAHASAHGLRLVTKDRTILENLDLAVWE